MQSLYSKLFRLRRPSLWWASPAAQMQATTAGQSGDASQTIPPTMATATRRKSEASSYNPLRMYLSCINIVAIWIGTGTLFYSICNDWPLPQSFFYAVDAGMSIGFCTDVAETKLVSKAFTIVYILLGASVVGGALALFIQDAVEGGIAIDSSFTKHYELLLEKEVFEKFNVSRSGVLSFEEFRQLLLATTGGDGNTSMKGGSPTTTSSPLTSEDIGILWTKFDRLKDGVIHFEEFAGTYRGIEALIASLRETGNEGVGQPTEAASNPALRPATAASSWIKIDTMWKSDNRIYFLFLGWVVLGVAWGVLDQGWDPITATHFAISALATGGLTAPRVNGAGILPARPAIFCGVYCLLGVPLMAVTLGHFARVLVADHVAAVEEWALTRPITAREYQVAKEYLKKRPSPYGSMRGREDVATEEDAPTSRGLRLSDFIVLQLLRQGRLSVMAMDVLRREFDALDKDRTGILTLEEATNWSAVEGRGGS